MTNIFKKLRAFLKKLTTKPMRLKCKKINLNLIIKEATICASDGPSLSIDSGEFKLKIKKDIWDLAPTVDQPAFEFEIDSGEGSWVFDAFCIAFDPSEKEVILKITGPINFIEGKS